MLVLCNCAASDIKVAIYGALAYIFEEETLGKRLCAVIKKAKKSDSTFNSTPNGGAKLRFGQLPTLIGSTMNCKFRYCRAYNIELKKYLNFSSVLAVALTIILKATTIEETKRSTAAVPPFKMDNTYREAVQKMRDLKVTKALLIEVKAAIKDARANAHKKLNKTAVKQLVFGNSNEEEIVEEEGELDEREEQEMYDNDGGEEGEEVLQHQYHGETETVVISRQMTTNEYLQ
jgi:hypothetical protein